MTEATPKPARKRAAPVQAEEPASPSRGRRAKAAAEPTAMAEDQQPPESIAPKPSPAVPGGFMPWGESAADFNARMASLPDRLAMIDKGGRK